MTSFLDNNNHNQRRIDIKASFPQDLDKLFETGTDDSNINTLLDRIFEAISDSWSEIRKDCYKILKLRSSQAKCGNDAVVAQLYVRLKRGINSEIWQTVHGSLLGLIALSSVLDDNMKSETMEKSIAQLSHTQESVRASASLFIEEICLHESHEYVNEIMSRIVNNNLFENENYTIGALDCVSSLLATPYFLQYLISWERLGCDDWYHRYFTSIIPLMKSESSLVRQKSSNIFINLHKIMRKERIIAPRGLEYIQNTWNLITGVIIGSQCVNNTLKIEHGIETESKQHCNVIESCLLIIEECTRFELISNLECNNNCIDVSSTVTSAVIEVINNLCDFITKNNFEIRRMVIQMLPSAAKLVVLSINKPDEMISLWDRLKSRSNSTDQGLGVWYSWLTELALAYCFFADALDNSCASITKFIHDYPKRILETDFHLEITAKLGDYLRDDPLRRDNLKEKLDLVKQCLRTCLHSDIDIEVGNSSVILSDRILCEFVVNTIIVENCETKIDTIKKLSLCSVLESCSRNPTQCVLGADSPSISQWIRSFSTEKIAIIPLINQMSSQNYIDFRSEYEISIDGNSLKVVKLGSRTSVKLHVSQWLCERIVLIAESFFVRNKDYVASQCWFFITLTVWMDECMNNDIWFMKSPSVKKSFERILVEQLSGFLFDAKDSEMQTPLEILCTFIVTRFRTVVGSFADTNPSQNLSVKLWLTLVVAVSPLMKSHELTNFLELAIASAAKLDNLLRSKALCTSTSENEDGDDSKEFSDWDEDSENESELNATSCDNDDGLSALIEKALSWSS